MSNPVATIIIPFAPYHAHLVNRAIDSALCQTVPCEVIFRESPVTPARVRNEGMDATTPFVVWLDADDVLATTFVEDCLRVYERGKYIYTTWLEGDTIRSPRDCPFFQGSYHIVTTLYPTALFKYIGGFDETLPGGEDIDFYLKSSRYGICGTFLNKPLVARPDDSGQRSKDYIAMDVHDKIRDGIVEKHGGVINIMGCCGGQGAPAGNNPGAQMPGDVLAQTLWAGMRSENGHVSGRMYIGGNGNHIWVDPADADAMPRFFRVVQDLRQLAPDKETVLKAAGLT